uniref:Secreted protein n=1 Tax=Streptomyces sp. NBC_00180 TaxID=2903632 RepID=A0AAU1I7U7_9ACTN
MAVSLGMRISGLLVVGAVAVAAAAFTSDGRGSADGRGGDGSVVTAGPSEGGSGPTAPADRSAPVAQQSPNGRAGENASGPAVVPSGLPGGVVSASPSPSPTPSPSGRGTVVLQAPPWLPPGPSSPDSDDTPDPASVYDLLRAPERCASALGKIPQASAEAEWQLLRGLSAACLAVQGRGGDWDTAAGAHAGLAGRVDTCKGRAAYAVLGGLLDFHRRHPGGTVRLAATPGGTPACGYRIAGVDTGGDGEARPGDTIGIELTGTYFDHAELLRDASVSIGGLVVPGVPVLKPESGDRLVLSVPVPPLEPGPAEVAVRHAGTEVRLPAAFTVTGPDTVEEPGTGTGATDEPGSPSGAAVSDLGERLSSLGAEVPAGGGSVSPPGADVPDLGGPVSSLGTEVPAGGGSVSPPDADVPDLTGPMPSPGAQSPTDGRPVSPPDADVPDLTGPMPSPGAQSPTDGKSVSPPGAKVPDLAGPASSPGPEMPAGGTTQLTDLDVRDPQGALQPVAVQPVMAATVNAPAPPTPG